MASNTNTASLNAENLGPSNTYENPNVNPTTSQGFATGGSNLGNQRLGGGSTNPNAGYRGTEAPMAAEPGYGSTASVGGVENSIGRGAGTTGNPATLHSANPTTSTIGGGDARTTRTGGIGHQIKGALAQGHGVGEVIRGKFNSAVDTAAGDVQGQAKNKNITTGGEREFAGKEFVKKGTTDKAL
ncbi:hypothetical protein EsH8_I_001384 [Colletotrichum jinshuiense]